jgi:cell division inhibitor SepF
MPQMLRKAMHFLGLNPDDEYDDGMPDDEFDPATIDLTGSGEHHSPANGAVRALPRDRERNRDHDRDRHDAGAAPVARPRPGVVRSIGPRSGPAPASAPGGAKPHTIAPTSFLEAQEVADRYMAGTPVILNLQGVERDLSRRLVDFASGLCYGLRGQMERVTNQVYLLTPSDVEVSAEDRRRLHEHDTA